MPTAKSKSEERKKYIRAFNSTMISIWKEKIAKLGAVRTGSLYSSVIPITMKADADFLDVTLAQQFNTYGIFVNYGTGREVPRGNGGDIGRAKLRRAKPWFSKKYFASVMNLQEFMADNLGQQSAHVVADALNVDSLRKSITK